MTALVAGFLLVGYLLAPGAIYRFVFSQVLPSKRIQRTRTEEILFSVLAVILPFALAFGLSRTFIGSFPHLHTGGSKGAAYEAVLQALLSSSPVPNVVSAFERAFYEQARFLLYLWPLCAFEAWLVGRLVRHYGDFQEHSFARWLCDRFLLKQVSEWHVLFSRMSLPTNDPRTVVVVDALTSQNLIYRGSLVNWFLEQDGKLAGIFLEDAERFNRDDLRRDREAGVERDHEEYWTAIPGAKLYLTSVSITNYNVSYQTPLPSAEKAAITAELSLGEDIDIKPFGENSY